MPDRNFRFFAECIQNIKTLGMGDVFKVDTSKRRLDPLDGLDDLIRIFCPETDRESVYTAQILIEQRFPLHDGHTRFGTDVSES